LQNLPQREITLLGKLLTGRVGMDITKDIQPMTTFRNHSAEIMQHLKDTKRPVILTVNGKAAAVVQDAEAYQHLLDLAAEASAAEGIRQGLDDLRTGRTRPAVAVLDEIRADYGIPR
jgi:prevent-host-death family protein